MKLEFEEFVNRPILERSNFSTLGSEYLIFVHDTIWCLLDEKIFGVRSIGDWFKFFHRYRQFFLRVDARGARLNATPI